MNVATTKCCGCGGPAPEDNASFMAGLGLCDDCLLLMALRIEEDLAEVEPPALNYRVARA